MRYVTQVGMCCAMSFGLVAVALGQQTAADRAAGRQPGAPAAGAIGQPGAQPGTAELQSGAAPSSPDQKYINTQPELNRTRDQMHRGRPQAMVTTPPEPNQTSASANGQSRGELGVYMVASGDRGVNVSRITPGSAAEQAGLREGDVILQVNGRGATTPDGTAQIIRQVPAGQSLSLTVMRDGREQQVQATMRPARQRRQMTGDLMDRDPYQVGFRGEDAGSAGGESTLKVRQLEQQVASLQQELQQMRQEITQLRSAGGAAGGISAGGQGLTPPQGAGSDLTPPSAGAAGTAGSPAGSGATDRSAAGSATTTTSGAGGTSTSGAATTPSATDRSGAAGSTSGTGSTSGAAGSTPGGAGSTSGGAGSTSGNTSSGAAGSTSGSPSGGAAGSTSGAGTSGAGTSGAGSSTSGAAGAAGGSPASGSSSKTGNDAKSSNDDLFGK